MKQKEDNKTIDMWVDSPTPASKRYRFWIETTSGEEVEWRGLTIHKAKQMYAYTDKHQPSNMRACGWGETK